MAQFQIYNYQFGQLLDNSSKDLFGNDSVLMKAEKSFPIRQELLNQLIEEDYKNQENEKRIQFKYPGHIKEYNHRHIIKPIDGMIVMRIANKKRVTRIDKNFEKTNDDDYANCIVIIDNRPGIQRMAIEVKKSVFTSDTTLEKIISNTFNEKLRPYSLYIDLMHIQNPKDFWVYINDKRSYPTGFYKIKFHHPYLNLERLYKKFDKLTTELRKSYNAKLDWELTAQKGGSLDISENNEMQKAQIEYFMQDLGGNNLELIPNDNKKKSIKVGKGSYQYMFISDITFERLKEDAKDNSFYDSPALDQIKIDMKKGTD